MNPQQHPPMWTDRASSGFIRSLRRMTHNERMDCLYNRISRHLHIVEHLKVKDRMSQDPNTWCVSILKCTTPDGDFCVPQEFHIRFLEAHCRNDKASPKDRIKNILVQDEQEQVVKDRDDANTTEAAARDEADEVRTKCGARTRFVQGANLVSTTL